MKKLLIMALVVACALGARAEPEVIDIPVLDVSTTAVSTVVDNPYKFTGFVHAFWIDFQSVGMTCDVAIVTITNVSGEPSITLFSATTLSSDALYYPRFATHWVDGTAAATNPPTRLLLVKQALRVSAVNSTTTNHNLAVKVFLDRRWP